MLNGQTVDLRFTEFGHNNNLSSVFLQTIEQDKLGFMWFGTSNGLHRFDGYELKNYLSEEGESYKIKESNIDKLYCDSKGWLWISLNSNLCYYDVATDSIKVLANENQTRGLNNYYITSFAEDKDSVLYVSTSNAVFRFNRDSLHFSMVAKVGNGQISKIVIDNDQNFWISSFGGGIIKYEPLSDGYSQLNIPIENSSILSVADIQIYDDKLWIATDGVGVWSFNMATGEFKNYPTDNDYARNVQELYLDKDGFLWMIDFTGLKLYVKDRDFFQGYYPERENKYSMPPYIKGIFQDHDNNYWTIHSPGGIGFCPKPKGINRFDSHINSPFKLTTDNVSTICEDQYGNLWMGNPFNGIDVFRWQKGKTDTYLFDNSNPNSLGKGATECIFRDSKQQMWVGSYWGGLQLYRPETDDFVSFVNDPENQNSIANNDVRSIAEDHEGNLWLVVHGKGIDKFNPQEKIFTHFSFEKNNLANNYTFQVLVDSADNIWVATAWGLSFLEHGTTHFKNYMNSENDENSISSNLNNTIYIDNLNRLWVGTPMGLNLYRPKTDDFERINNGFANRNVVAISSDLENNIWISTYYGISRYNPETGNILNLSKDDGLISNDFLPRSVFNNGKNTLFFGSVDGINYFSPDKIKYNNNAPEVYITKLKVLNQNVTNHNSNLLKNNVVQTKKIVLGYDQKILEIEFSALNYVSPQNNRYSYYLEGFEHSWNEPVNKRTVTYTNLSPGKYIFRVKASNNEGVWNDVGTSLIIIITPPFWSTIWFKLTLIAFIVGLIGFIIKYREKSLVSDKLLLEQKVQERTFEINHQKEELEQQKLLLEETNNFKSKFFNVLAHDLKGPISTIMQLTTLLKDRFNSDQRESVERIIDLTRETATNTHDLLVDLLIWGKAQTKNIHLEFDVIDLKQLIKNTVENLSNIASLKQIEIVIAKIDDSAVYADSYSIKTVLRNLISNAIKFSNMEGKIIIEGEILGDEYIVKIEDFGIGMNEEILDSIFLYNLKKSNVGTAGERGTGMGISLSQELVKLNGGRIWATSQLEKGSIFYFSLPLNKPKQ